MNDPFSYVYIEDAVYGTSACQEILRHLPKSRIIRICRYRDLFDRKRQNIRLQHAHPALILAKKEGTLIYPGAPVCQDFGNNNFYYTSTAMNCLYDCDYCFLKGMYPSGNLVLFLNLDDVFRDVEKLLNKGPVYLCISYDTDLMALESLAHQVETWSHFTMDHEDLTIEIRTKCARTDIFEKIDPSPRVIFAYTMSPDKIISRFEHGTSSLSARAGAASFAIKKGFPVRLCFDPMISVPGWKEIYAEMVRELKTALDCTKVKDASVGTFRISRDYLKHMRANFPDSAITLYPYTLDDGYYHYGKALDLIMEEYLIHLLLPEIPHSHIFTWREN